LCVPASTGRAYPCSFLDLDVVFAAARTDGVTHAAALVGIVRVGLMKGCECGLEGGAGFAGGAVARHPEDIAPVLALLLDNGVRRPP
jgi:hypothetical protein